MIGTSLMVQTNRCKSRESSRICQNNTVITTEKRFCSGDAYNLIMDLALLVQFSLGRCVKFYAPPLDQIEYIEIYTNILF